MASRTIIDVGANAGDFAIEMAQRGAERVIAIEPIPELAAAIRERARQAGLGSVEVVEMAVDLVAGRAEFNVAEHADWGVSSLFPFRKEIEADDYWKHRADLYFDRRIEVDVRTMRELVKTLVVEEIAFIKIDAQGKDLDVLRSFGPHLSKVKAGMLEMATTSSGRLYEGETAVLVEALNFLRESKFDVYGVKPNDPACNEVNIYFNRSDVDWRELEEELGLRGVSLYDGKWFWHVPSPTVDSSAEAQIAAWKSEADRHIVETRRLARELGESRAREAQLTASLDAARGEEGRLGNAMWRLASDLDRMRTELETLQRYAHRRASAESAPGDA